MIKDLFIFLLNIAADPAAFSHKLKLLYFGDIADNHSAESRKHINVDEDSTEIALINKLMLEYKILQTKIDSYGSYSYKIKGIIIPLTGGAIYYIFKNQDIFVAFLSLVGVLFFLFHEVRNNIYKTAIINRLITLERYLNYDLIRRSKRVRSPRIAHTLISKDLTTFTSYLKEIKRNWKSDFLYYLLIPTLLYSITYILGLTILFYALLFLILKIIFLFWVMSYIKKSIEKVKS